MRPQQILSASLFSFVIGLMAMAVIAQDISLGEQFLTVCIALFVIGTMILFLKNTNE